MLPVLNVYLAGKVSVHKCIAPKWEAVAGLQHNFVASDDRYDHNHGSQHAFNLSWEKCVDRNVVAERFIGRLQTCHCLIAYLHTPDSFGSIAEVAWSAAHKLPSLMVFDTDADFVNGDTGHGDDLRSDMGDAYWFVASLPGIESVIVSGIADAGHEIDRWLYKKSYHLYLKTPEWKVLRHQALRRANYQCALCTCTGNLQVHHRHYRNVGNEEIEDLIVLCRNCHAKHHDKTGEAA